MTNTDRERFESRDEERRTEESRRRIKEKLYKAKASGQLDEDDEALILAYAAGVVTRREKDRDDRACS